MGSGTIGNDQAVARGSVVVGCGKAADVQPAVAAGGDDRSLGLDGEELLGVEAVKDSATAMAPVVEDQLHRRLELAQRDHVRVVLYLVHEGAHDNGADIVAAGDHALT